MNKKVYMKWEKYSGTEMGEMEGHIDISPRVIGRSLRTWNFSRNLKKIGMQALRSLAGHDAQHAEKAIKCKGPGAEACLASLRKTSRSEFLRQSEWWGGGNSWRWNHRGGMGPDNVGQPSAFCSVRHGNSLESFEQNSETIWPQLLKVFPGHC